MTLAVLCSGQGGQNAGMFDLIDGVATTREALERAREAVGFDPSEAARAGSPRMFDNAIAQPSICMLQLATWALLGPRLEAAGVAPVLFAGYSVGELAAWGCAGAFTFDETLGIAAERAAAMDAASAPGDGLVALRGMTRAAVDALCEAGGGHVAIVNGDDQHIVGGSAMALGAIEQDATRRGGVAQRLPVAVAAHTPLLCAAVPRFRRRLEAASWTRPAAPVLAGIDGSAVRGRQTAIDTLAKQVATTIRWSACMDSVAERGVTVCLELGPGNALARMLRDRHGDIEARSVTDFRSLDAVVDWATRMVGSPGPTDPRSGR